MVLRPIAIFPANRAAAILLGLLTLIVPAAGEAAEPWESDPIGVQAYNAYQGLAGSYNLEAYLDNTENYFWGESYLLQAFAAMYEGTKDTACLDKLVNHFDVVLSNRDDRLGIVDEYRGYVMPAWSTSSYSDQNYAWGVHAGMLTAPIARFIYQVKSTPSLYPQYLAKAQEYETAIRETVDAFDVDWRSSGASEGYYVYYTGGKVPYNCQNTLGRTFVSLWLATGESKYLDKATRLANYFKNDLTTVGNRYKWNYSTGGSAEDISHAAHNVDFVAQCYRAGIVFNATDMAKFANTFKYISQGEDGFTVYVDGSGGVDDSYSPLAGGWGRLGYVDEEVRQVLSDYFGVYPTSPWQDRAPRTGMVAASYLVETSRDLAFESPIPTNMSPWAANDSYSLYANVTLNIDPNGVLANDIDLENDPLSAIKVSDPTHGALTLNSDGSLTYIPASGWIGTDMFTYMANDGSLDSNVATVNLIVNPGFVTLGLVDNGCPAAGLHSYTLTATGPGITTLGQFTIDGEVHQVFDAEGNPSEWLGDGSASESETTDSHVIFGNLRIPDLGGGGDKVTEETITAGGNSGMGTLNNYDEDLDIRDAYMKFGMPSGDDETVELMQLVVADGDGFSIDLALFTSTDYDPITGESTVTVHDLSFTLPTLTAGDADGDGDVDTADVSILAQHWLQAGTWADGDFNRDGVVNDIDATMLAANWNPQSANVPEPNMLVLLTGMLFLAMLKTVLYKLPG